MLFIILLKMLYYIIYILILLYCELHDFDSILLNIILYLHKQWNISIV